MGYLPWSRQGGAHASSELGVCVYAVNDTDVPDRIGVIASHGGVGGVEVAGGETETTVTAQTAEEQRRRRLAPKPVYRNVPGFFSKTSCTSADVVRYPSFEFKLRRAGGFDPDLIKVID